MLEFNLCNGTSVTEPVVPCIAGKPDLLTDLVCSEEQQFRNDLKKLYP
ncbi:MAG: hypothetical protein VXZ82_03540 [Planctomycetota bacterium]|nr:hypothetical protein [Planctomycetota bacterium]